jgi:hypothetical protein
VSPHVSFQALFDSFSWINRMGRLSLPLSMLVRAIIPPHKCTTKAHLPIAAMPLRPLCSFLF